MQKTGFLKVRLISFTINEYQFCFIWFKDNTLILYALHMFTPIQVALCFSVGISTVLFPRNSGNIGNELCHAIIGEALTNTDVQIYSRMAGTQSSVIQSVSARKLVVSNFHFILFTSELRRKKTCHRGFWKGLKQTGLSNHRRWLEAWKFGFME